MGRQPVCVCPLAGNGEGRWRCAALPSALRMLIPLPLSDVSTDPGVSLDALRPNFENTGKRARYRKSGNYRVFATHDGGANVCRLTPLQCSRRLCRLGDSCAAPMGLQASGQSQLWPSPSVSGAFHHFGCSGSCEIYRSCVCGVSGMCLGSDVPIPPHIAGAFEIAAR